MRAVGIFAQKAKPESQQIAFDIACWLRHSGVQVLANPETSALLHCPGFDWDRPDIDCLIVLGGDGTLLSMAREVAPHAIPILGVNLGHLGFLAEVQPAYIGEALDRLMRGDYTIEERTMVRASVERKGKEIRSLLALNDVVVSKGAFARIVRFSTYVGEEFFGSFPADGIIVSSPTGSTAYSLSAGGPLISPDIDVLVMTPICPHTLFSRSIVVSGSGYVRVAVDGPHEEVAVTADGQVGLAIESGDEIVISRASERTRFIRLRSKSFYGILRERLKEGRL